MQVWGELLVPIGHKGTAAAWQGLNIKNSIVGRQDYEVRYEAKKTRKSAAS
jgi:hypothetical protein